MADFNLVNFSFNVGSNAEFPIFNINKVFIEVFFFLSVVKNYFLENVS